MLITYFSTYLLNLLLVVMMYYYKSCKSNQALVQTATGCHRHIASPNEWTGSKITPQRNRNIKDEPIKAAQNWRRNCSNVQLRGMGQVFLWWSVRSS